MKRKTRIKPNDVVVENFFDPLPLIVAEEKAKPAYKCAVCGGESTAESAEHLCWVCRRLKISAWRDSEQQVAAQE